MYDDLLEQARILAKLDVKKPKQAILRRAVSAAYYAVFHFLVHEACCAQIGTQHAQAAYRHVLGRAFVHGQMKLACSSFGGGTLRKEVIKGLPRNAHGNYVIPKAIQDIAEMFVELQENASSWQMAAAAGLRPEVLSGHAVNFGKDRLGFQNRQH